MAGSNWFVPKSHGYGAVPSSWEGWVCVGATVAVIAALAFFCFGVGEDAPTTIGIAIFVAGTWAAVIALVFVARAHTAGGWRWRWGSDA